eukprot:3149918-Alexandrium_andersonii.AAC.1
MDCKLARPSSQPLPRAGPQPATAKHPRSPGHRIPSSLSSKSLVFQSRAARTAAVCRARWGTGSNTGTGTEWH